MDAYHSHTQILNRYTVAQVLQSETVVSAVRKELKKLFPDVKVDPQSLLDIFNNEILKRDVIEGEKVKEAQAKLKKQYTKLAKQQEKAKVKEDRPVVEVGGEGGEGGGL